MLIKCFVQHSSLKSFVKNAGTVSVHVYTLFVCFFKEAIITICNCCCDNQYGCAKRFLNKHTPPLSLSFFLSLFLFVRAATAHLPFGLGLYCLTFFYLPSLFPPPLPPVFCAPVSADLVPSRPNACLPACLPARGYRRLPKSRKRRCVINGTKRKTLWPLYFHSHLLFFDFIFACLCILFHLCLKHLNVHALSSANLCQVYLCPSVCGKRNLYLQKYCRTL